MVPLHPSHLQKPWADKELGEKGFKPKWNTLDGDINRASHQVGRRTLLSLVANAREDHLRCQRK